MEYTEKTYTNIIDSIRCEVGDRAQALSYAKSREIFRETLNEIVTEYRCQFLGFNLIRLLHEKEGYPVPYFENWVKIRGLEFLRDNMSAPSNICDEDKRKYAHILASMTLQNDNFEMDRELAIARFEVLLKENLYLEDDLITKREITRKDILNISRGLELDFYETNSLLFRTLESSVLTGTSAADLIERFVIENNQSVLERESMLAEYADRATHRKTAVDKRKESITQFVRDSFYEKVLSKSKDIYYEYEDLRKLCLDYLVENARFLDAPNRTAMLLYEKLLCYVRDVMNGSLSDEYVDMDVFDRLDTILIKDQQTTTLSEESCIKLVQSLLTSANCDSMEAAYSAWSVPSINQDGNIVKEELGTRMEKILRGDSDISIQKKDIIFALFLACSLDWEYDDTIAVDILIQRLAQFENLANALLANSFLEHDRFYLPHPLEASIAISIMCGPLAEGVFRDVTDELTCWSGIIKTNSTAAKKKLPKAVKEEEKKPDMDRQSKRVYKRVQNACCSAMEALLKDSKYTHTDQTIALEQLKRVLSVPSLDRIEAINLSHMLDTEILAQMVVIQNGNPYRREYRLLDTQKVNSFDGNTPISKAVKYRFNQFLDENDEFKKMPDLLIVEGNDRVVREVSAVLENMKLKIPVAGISYDVQNEQLLHRLELANGEQITIDQAHPAFSLIKTIREETHRYALCYQAWVVASEIRNVWVSENLRSIDVYFDENGEWGYLPATSIGVQYRSVGKTPRMVHDILYGNAKVEIPFVSRVLTGRDEVCTVQGIISSLFSELDKTRVRYLHRKAVLYLVLGQMQDARSSFIYHTENREANSLTHLDCEAHVMGHRIMKLKGYDMVTQQVRDM